MNSKQVEAAEADAKKLMQMALDDNLSLAQIWVHLEACHRTIAKGGVENFGYRIIGEEEVKRQVGEAREAIKRKDAEGDGFGVPVVGRGDAD